MEINNPNIKNSLVKQNFLTKGGTKKNIIKNEPAMELQEHNITNPNRLNALDSTLMENSAYKNIDNESFKTEYRIEKLENQLNAINRQLEGAVSLNDKTKIDMLNMKKHIIENELKELYSAYKSSNVTGQLSVGISSVIKPRKSIISTVKERVSDFVAKNILSKISKRFNTGLGLKSALNKLENINKNVDELVSSQTPYGEAEDKYDQLSRYLTKANTIQYKVSMDLTDNTKIKRNPFDSLTSKESADALEKKLKSGSAKKDTAQKNALNLNNNLK